MRCRAVRYCAALCGVLRCTFYFVHVRYHSKYHTRFVSTTLLSHKKCTPRSAQPSNSSAAPRSAVRCRAVPCLPCGAVPCYAFFRTCSTTYQLPVCTCVLVSLFSSFGCPLSVLFRVLWQITPVLCPSESDIANKHTAQRGAASSKPALGIIKSLLLVAPNHGPFPSAPFT